MVTTFEENRGPIASAVVHLASAYLVAHPAASPEEVADVVTGEVDLSGFDDMVDPAAEALQPAVTEGGEGMIVELKVTPSPFEQVHQYALDYARARAAEMIGRKFDAFGQLIDDPDADMDIMDSTRNMIHDLVVKALSPPDDVGTFNLTEALENLKNDVSGGYLFSRERAKLIAHVEIGTAHSEGELSSLLALSDRGLEVEKGWSTAKDDKVCSEICAENAAAGWIPVTHLFPSGHRTPLGHPWCRCALIGRIKPQTENTQ